MLPTQVTIAREEASLGWPGSAAPALLRSRFHNKLPGSGYVPDTGPAFVLRYEQYWGFTVGCLASFRFVADADLLALWSAPRAVHGALRVAFGGAPYARCAALDVVPCPLRAVPHGVPCQSWESSPFQSADFARLSCWAAAPRHLIPLEP
jgi:hypothetical protein